MFTIFLLGGKDINMATIHIGRMIQAELKAQGRSVTWFSGAIHRERSDVYKMFKRPSIDTDMLVRISKLLRHDFFRDFSEGISMDENTL